MISFKDRIHHNYSMSQHKNIAVFTFGRFNPPTKGHEKLFTEVHKIADELDGTPFVFPSVTCGKRGDKHNPLPITVKIEYIKKLMPWCNIVNETTVNSAWAASEYLTKQGFTQIYLVVGSDRTDEFKRRWVPYTEQLADKAEVVNAGYRDPDGEGITAMSASKAQKAALKNDVKLFQSVTGWSGNIAISLMKDVAQYLKKE